MQLRCKNCSASFEGERDARCPKCLRVTSVVVIGDEGAGAGGDGASGEGEGGGGAGAGARGGGGAREVRSASWPAGTTCPLCLEREVSERPEAIFYFQLARQIEKGARWLHVRCRSCDECRLRVEALSRHRKIAAPFVAFAVVAAGLSLFADGPFVKAGISFPSSIAAGMLVAFVVGGIPLYVVDRGNRALRRHLESSWLFRTVKASFTSSDGFMSEDQWRVLPDVPEREKGEALKGEEIAK